LDHEGGDYAVEEEGVVVAAAGEGGEVFAGLRELVWSRKRGDGGGEDGYLWGVFVVEFYYYCALSLESVSADFYS
jgi:hypothetical protein